MINDALTHVSQLFYEAWPLEAFIASNPQWDRTDRALKDVLSTLPRPLSPERHYQQAYQQGIITEEALKATLEEAGIEDITHWLTQSLAYEEQFSPTLLSEQIGHFRFESALHWSQTQSYEFLLYFFSHYAQDETASLETFYRQMLPKQHSRLNQVLTGSSARDDLTALLSAIGVEPEQYQTYLTAVAWQVYGWGCLIKWLSNHPDNPWLQVKADLVSLLVIWLAHEWLISHHTQTRYHAPLQAQAQHDLDYWPRQHLWQTALERSYHAPVLETLRQTAKALSPSRSKPNLQAVLCIDTRSEGLRRHLEKEGVETFGFAGFFGFAFRCKQEHTTSMQCPALLNPSLVVKMTAPPLSAFKQLKKSTIGTINASKSTFASPFALFEMFGFWALVKLALKTFTPSSFHKHFDTHAALDENSLTLNWDDPNGLTLEQATDAAEGMLRTIGLTQHFAPHILLCAHQSQSDNNPFAASLDCGACGGNSGIPNAILAAKVLNDEQIRAQLSQRGIGIPDGTRFIAACHHTTDDRMECFTQSPTESIQPLLSRACQHLRQERVQDLPTQSKPTRRAANWAELIPELGLAKNALMVVGPRVLTQSISLDRRAFLHSYQPESDPESAILTSIFNAPVIVAHWINMQYFFSTLYPRTFGAGNKAIHNVIPGIGVMEGNISDLKIGLPLQSTHFRNKLVHHPLRLMVVVYATLAQVERALTNSPKLKQLIEGEWLKLEVIEPHAEQEAR